jgi:hypothetical protein
VSAGEPPDPPALRSGHFTVIETTGIFFGPGLRTTISMLEVVASRCCPGKLALTISTG